MMTSSADGRSYTNNMKVTLDLDYDLVEKIFEQYFKEQYKCIHQDIIGGHTFYDTPKETKKMLKAFKKVAEHFGVNLDEA